MLNIVELREMSSDRLHEMLENAREEMFNLRFQQASARLENFARLKQVRREVAQLQTVLHMRDLAIAAAAGEPALADALAGQEWSATARYVYEDAGWRVEFADHDGNSLGRALVDLNKKQPKGRQARQTRIAPRLVIEHEVAG